MSTFYYSQANTYKYIYKLTYTALTYLQGSYAFATTDRFYNGSLIIPNEKWET